MRVYEVIFILKPDLAEEEGEAVIQQIQNVITDAGETIDKVDKWGKRRLAYRVRRYLDGYYVLIQYTVAKNLGLAKEIERRLRVNDAVIKHLTVRIDEDLKKAEKIKLKREERAARKPAAASRPAPAKPAAEAPEQPVRPRPAVPAAVEENEA
jgi:small subunit ribosomal protein S6